MSVSWWVIGNVFGFVILKVWKLEVIVGLNGFYDLKYFIDNFLEFYVNLKQVYVDFMKGVFGEDEQVWRIVCLIDVFDWFVEWFEGWVVIVVQSREDGFVLYF